MGRQSLLTIPRWLEVARESICLPDGRVIDDFYLISMPDYAAIVPLLPDGRVVTQRRYKHGSRAVTLGLPGGYLEPGEEPLVAAKRELMEETGYQSEQWKFLGDFVVDANRGCGVAHMFLARDCITTSEPGSSDLEEVQMDLMDLDKIRDSLQRGVAMELSTVAALGLTFLELMKQEVQRTL